MYKNEYQYCFYAVLDQQGFLLGRIISIPMIFAFSFTQIIRGFHQIKAPPNPRILRHTYLPWLLGQYSMSVVTYTQTLDTLG